MLFRAVALGLPPLLKGQAEWETAGPTTAADAAISATYMDTSAMHALSVKADLKQHRSDLVGLRGLDDEGPHRCA